MRKLPSVPSIKTYPLKLYVRKWPIALFGGMGLLLNILSWLWLFIQIPDTTGQLFLHYNVLFGVDYIAEGWRVFFVPLQGLGIYIINMLLSWLVYRYDAFMSYVLTFIAFFVQIFIMISAVLIVFLNV